MILLLRLKGWFNQEKEKKGEVILILLLLLFFTTDSLNVIVSGVSEGEFGNTSRYTKLSTISKGAFLISYLFYALLFYTKKSIVVIGAVLVFFFIAHQTYPEGDFYFYFTWIIRPAKLILPFILFGMMVKVIKGSVSKVFRLFVAFIAVQSVIVILALIFGIELFRTYNANRFGYSGMIVAQNEATFYYVIAFVFLFRQWELKKEKLYLVLMILVLIASMVLGTKAIFIFLASLMLYITFSQNRFNIFILLGTFITFGTGILYLFYLFGAFNFLIAYLDETDWITMITSFRNLLIEERLPGVFARWEWYNYLFGGINPTNSYVEMDIIDMFTYSGVLGSLIYYWMLFKKLFKFSRKNYLGWFLVSQYFLIGGLAGHVFASGINAMYLALTCYYLQVTEMSQDLKVQSTN